MSGFGCQGYAPCQVGPKVRCYACGSTCVRLTSCVCVRGRVSGLRAVSASGGTACVRVTSCVKLGLSLGDMRVRLNVSGLRAVFVSGLRCQGYEMCQVGPKFRCYACETECVRITSCICVRV